jgi:hypothetical protein
VFLDVSQRGLLTSPSSAERLPEAAAMPHVFSLHELTTKGE